MSVLLVSFFLDVIINMSQTLNSESWEVMLCAEKYYCTCFIAIVCQCSFRTDYGVAKP